MLGVLFFGAFAWLSPIGPPEPPSRSTGFRSGLGSAGGEYAAGMSLSPLLRMYGFTQANMAENRLLESPLARNQILIDVGANSAIDYTLPGLANDMVVFSFEPLPRYSRETARAAAARGKPVFDLMELRERGGPKNMPASALYITHQVAVSNESGTFSFLADEGEMTSLAAAAQGEKKVRVAHMKLDDLLSASDFDATRREIFMFKLDCQGYESRVLRGAETLLRETRIRFLTFEFWPHGIRQAGDDPVELLRFVHRAGFHCADYGTGKSYVGKDLHVHVTADRPSEFAAYVSYLDRTPAHGEFIGFWDEIICWRN